MTTQGITATVGSGMMSREFTATATDGQWDGNILTDSVANTNLGLVMPNRMIDRVAVQYEGGACIWRIQSSQTLVVKRYGYANKDGYTCYESTVIAPYTVQPDDILTVYPLPVNIGAGTANILAWVQTSRGFEAFGKTGAATGTAETMKTLVNDQTLGDYAFNANLQTITVQCQDDALIDKVELIDQTGGVVWTAFGNARMPTAGGTNAYYNFKAEGLGISILKGYNLKITPTVV